MKAYTDLEQSKKLAEILPIDSADMWWNYTYDVISETGKYDTEPMLHKPICDSEHAIPCWSLAALLEIIPFPHLSWYKYEDSPLKWNCVSIPKLDSKDISSVVEVRGFSDAIDACVEMILKLKEQDLL